MSDGIKNMFNLKNTKIAIIGLGYVGLPLAIEFNKKYPVIGFDINKSRIKELQSGADSTYEITESELAKATSISFSNDTRDLLNSNVFIVTVPTPINKYKQPDLTPLIKASEMLGKIIKKNDVIIYESTVYPGATEEDCLPVIERVSGLKYNEEFFAGYSPERINPGDKEHRVSNILKVTSGSNDLVADYVDNLYKSIIKAGTHKADSIKIAEASKIIENVQRDVNIALINEFFQIFNKLEIDTNKVIEAASTKWNFMKLKPGLVGGHCIGVDPYYLLHKANQNGYIADLMRAGREINDSMPEYLVNDFISNLLKKQINPIGLEVALLGFSFKENCPDIRNTKVHEIYERLVAHGLKVNIYDPEVDINDVATLYGVEIKDEVSNITEDVAFLCVGHEKIIENIKNYKYVYDFKSIVNS